MTWMRQFNLHHLAGLLGLLLLTTAQQVYSGCSPYVGLATFNEYYHSNQSPTNANQYFIETKLLATSMRSKYKDWTVLICSQVAADNLTNTCITGDLGTANAFADTGYDPDLDLEFATGTDWLVLDQDIGADGYLAGYVDNNGGASHGMEVFLLDINGDVIDYTSVDGYSVHGADLGVASCNFLYDNTFTGTNTFTMQRLPDGMGCWPEDPAITSDTTSGGSTISCIGASPPSGSSGSPTEETPNTDTTTTGTYPTISIQPTAVQVGGIATFTVTITGALIVTKVQGNLVYTYDTGVTTVGTDITFTVSTMDGSVIAPAAAVTSAQILAGTNSGTFTVDTASISPVPVTGDFFYGVIGISASDASGAIINTPNAVATFTAPAIDHLDISPNTATASTCSPTTVTISARDASNALVTDYTGTVDLSTSSGNGNWVLNTGGGTFNAGVADSGLADYSFIAADGGTASFDLSNQHSEDLTITAGDAAESLTSTSGTYTFSDNMFVVSDDGIRVAGKPITVTIEFWTMERDAGGNPILDASGNPTGCSLVSDYNNASQGLKAYLTLDGDHPAGATLPEIGGTTLPTSLPAADNLTLDFSAASGTSSLTLDTFDVGKYSLTLADDSGAYSSGITVSGTTAVMTVNPFAIGLNVYEATAGANPGGTATAGAAFISAATPFSTDIKGLLWEVADDADGDGFPDITADLTDNSLAPAFAWATALSEQATYTPATPPAGTLSGTLAITAASYSGGSVTVNDLKYAEVGSFTLAVTITNYLNTTGNNFNTPPQPVGRFYPDYLTLTAPVITPACGLFSYMDQNSLTLSASALAFNADGAIVSLYDNDTQGYLYTASLSLGAENNNDGVDLSGRLSGLPALLWTGGSANININNLQLSRGAIPEQFSALQLGGSLTDDDGATLRSADLDMDPSTTGACATCTFQALAGTQDFRFGRMVLDNAFGPETQPLTIPLRTEYYDATTLGFRINTEDSCSTYNSANATLSNPTGALPAAAAINDTLGDIALVNGLYNPLTPLVITAPGTGNTGTIDITLDLTAQPWLQYDWTNIPTTTYTDDPTATATFGSYRGNDHIIFWQEIFN